MWYRHKDRAQYQTVGWFATFHSWRTSVAPWALPRLEEATPISAGVRALDQHSFTGSSSIQKWLEDQSLNWSLEAWILVFWGRSQRCLLSPEHVHQLEIYLHFWRIFMAIFNHLRECPKIYPIVGGQFHFGQTNCWSNPGCCWSSPDLFLVDICFIA